MKFGISLNSDGCSVYAWNSTLQCASHCSTIWNSGETSFPACVFLQPNDMLGGKCAMDHYFLSDPLPENENYVTLAPDRYFDSSLIWIPGRNRQMQMHEIFHEFYSSLWRDLHKRSTDSINEVLLTCPNHFASNMRASYARTLSVAGGPNYISVFEAYLMQLVSCICNDPALPESGRILFISLSADDCCAAALTLRQMQNGRAVQLHYVKNTSELSFRRIDYLLLSEVIRRSYRGSAFNQLLGSTEPQIRFNRRKLYAEAARCRRALLGKQRSTDFFAALNGKQEVVLCEGLDQKWFTDLLAKQGFYSSYTNLLSEVCKKAGKQFDRLYVSLDSGSMLREQTIYAFDIPETRCPKWKANTNQAAQGAALFLGLRNTSEQILFSH